jgi:hypothetical protein
VRGCLCCSGLGHIKELSIGSEVDADAWLAEFVRPGTGFDSVRSISMSSSVTDVGLRHLARSDSGLRALRSLSIFDADVTNAGLVALARADAGTRLLTELRLDYTNVTDAMLRQLNPHLTVD